ncbi:hypothetical protein A4X09_0g7643, partial [Tilletia walkeri]
MAWLAVSGRQRTYSHLDECSKEGIASISTSTSSSSAGPERLVVPALCQPSLLADLPSHDTISTLLAKHIPPHIRPARDTSGTFPSDESPH